jgi:hypothetical protein
LIVVALVSAAQAVDLGTEVNHLVLRYATDQRRERCPMSPYLRAAVRRAGAGASIDSWPPGSAETLRS